MRAQWLEYLFEVYTYLFYSVLNVYERTHTLSSQKITKFVWHTCEWSIGMRIWLHVCWILWDFAVRIHFMTCMTLWTMRYACVPRVCRVCVWMFVIFYELGFFLRRCLVGIREHYLSSPPTFQRNPKLKHKILTFLCVELVCEHKILKTIKIVCVSNAFQQFATIHSLAVISHRKKLFIFLLVTHHFISACSNTELSDWFSLCVCVHRLRQLISVVRHVAEEVFLEPDTQFPVPREMHSFYAEVLGKTNRELINRCVPTIDGFVHVGANINSIDACRKENKLECVSVCVCVCLCEPLTFPNQITDWCQFTEINCNRKAANNFADSTETFHISVGVG